MLMDRIPNSDSKIFFATIFGINGDINSLDPKTKEKYPLRSELPAARVRRGAWSERSGAYR